MFCTMTPLPCPACGVIDTPRATDGTGLHTAKATCAHCGRFLKWLPKVVIGKDVGMHPSVNRCILLGQVGRDGVEVSFVGKGTARASFMLGLTELGSDGREHFAWFPCEIWGKRAEAVGELEPGALVLVEGKLKRQKKGEGSWETIVSGWECQVLTLPAPTPATTEGSAW
jgi:hypothetical protein